MSVKDWRGTEINIGDTVIYGSGVGRSIQLNEAIVVGFGKKQERTNAKQQETQRVKLEIVRRSYSSGGQEFVHVGSDRMTVIKELPVAAVPTQQEAKATREASLKERDRIYATHTRVEFNLPAPTRPDVSYWNDTYNIWRKAYGAWSQARHDALYAPCTVCGIDWREMGKVECNV